MMSDPEKWEEIFKYTIDQTSPDQERKEQMWNRLQSTISGRGLKVSFHRQLSNQPC